MDNTINAFAIDPVGGIYPGGAFGAAGLNISKYIACLPKEPAEVM